MQPERVLVAVAAAIVAVALAAALVVPGALAAPDETVRRPGPVNVAELSVQTGEISGASAGLVLKAQVNHRGNLAPNVSVRFRAIDTKSKFVASEETVSIGDLEDDGWTPAEATLRVPREGSYVIEATVFRDGVPVNTVRKRVSGLRALTPAYASTPVEFTEQGTTPTVAVSVKETGNDRATLEISASLTNNGDQNASDLRVVVYVRQPDSNVIADRAETAVGDIRAGRTRRASTTVQVPTGYNYYIDVALYSDGVLIDTTRSVANLAPDEAPLEVNETETGTEFNVSDFASGGGQRTGTATAIGTTEVRTPGFGVVAALASLLGALAVARRRR